jgi:hypothetical protein
MQAFGVSCRQTGSYRKRRLAVNRVNWRNIAIALIGLSTLTPTLFFSEPMGLLICQEFREVKRI